MGEIFLEETKIKLGLFGGTFDPVHNGHIYIALEAQELYDLDEVRWGVARHKKNTLIGFQKRRQMVSKACKAIGHKPTAFEYLTSYAWVTKHNLEKYDIYLIVGSDLREEIENWDSYKYLKNLCTFAWVDRLPGLSSTMIRERIKNHQHIASFVP